MLPLAVNEVTQVGLEAVAAAFAYGASGLRFLLREKPRHDVAGLYKTIALAEPILSGLGFGTSRIATIETDDPFALGETLRAIAPAAGVTQPAAFSAIGGKRDVLRLALRELHHAAPMPVDIVALPEGAPFGTVELNVEGCTLCLSCVAACPTGALSDDQERPVLRFAEDACVQCGLCKATCPEKVITLRPQLDFRAATARARVLKEEEPFCCISCGKPFGVKSSIERVAAKLEGKHWMFQNSAKRLDVIKMCADCRVTVMTNESFDPFAAPARPNPRTTEDYLREREREERRAKADYFVALAKKSVSALRFSAEPMRCSGIFVPGVYSAGPTSNSFATVSGVHTMSSFFSARRNCILAASRSCGRKFLLVSARRDCPRRATAYGRRRTPDRSLHRGHSR